jgi:transcription elongation factor GreA-like protein
MTYNINDKFYNEYPIEAYNFVKENGYKIVELEKEDGRRVFQIQAIVKTLNDLKAEKIVELKVKRDAYKKANNYDNSNIVDNILIGLGDYTDEERLACKTFFNNLIVRYDELKDLINNSTIDTINTISITFGE